ncbi:MAG: hypothetical protein NC097_06235 [Clostridium sp.]|nr:hypothetical protein [Prevotella sp.]MCM1429377.1 hypothetical protein [Clostridium sp.]MCM1475588.1 hypothetical protein [Muribaculaceae bacterium]
MRIFKYRYLAFASLAFLMAVACGKKEMQQTEQAEETAAEIEAAQMMGRDAARDFVNRQWDDTLQLQGALLEVRSIQSKFTIEGKKKSAAAFDSAFISTMRTVRPELSVHLDKYYK